MKVHSNRKCDSFGLEIKALYSSKLFGSNQHTNKIIGKTDSKYLEIRVEKRSRDNSTKDHYEVMYGQH